MKKLKLHAGFCLSKLYLYRFGNGTLTAVFLWVPVLVSKVHFTLTLKGL